ncbi:MAG: NAD(P)-dependent oxidoreductase [Pseudobutyrivibrio ruminis]|nr:NAD(P)-dependent oxidoreductase [Pseudobutyrivibrio ruminis]
MRVVITGAAGFAGYSLVEALVASGDEVYAILRPHSNHNARFDNHESNLHLIEIDCSDFDKIAEHISEECDIFYHLAWFGGRDDFAVQNRNIDYNLKAVESAHKLKCHRFVGIGSQAEYGAVSGVIHEGLMPKPINAYGSAKVAAMYLSKRRCEQLGIEWVWGRIFSLYGDYEPSGRMLPDLLTKLKNNEIIQLSSCEQNWDYLHVRDAAEAIVSIGQAGKSGEIYNIANGDYRSLKSFVNEAIEMINPDAEVIFGERANPFISLQPDVIKIKNHTGWQPKISFNEGVKRFIDSM